MPHTTCDTAGLDVNVNISISSRVAYQPVLVLSPLPRDLRTRGLFRLSGISIVRGHAQHHRSCWRSSGLRDGRLVSCTTWVWHRMGDKRTKRPDKIQSFRMHGTVLEQNEEQDELNLGICLGLQPLLATFRRAIRFVHRPNCVSRNR